jgi:hypothetical protein
MRHTLALAIALAAALAGSATTARAQNPTYIYVTANYPKAGLQFAADHWNASTGNQLGTNFGAGFRYETELPITHVRSYLDCNVFASQRLYTDATVNIVYSFDGLRAGITPFVGAGGTLVLGGDGGGVSLDLAVGTQLNRATRHIPYVEARYLTSGGRIVALFGMVF